MRFMAAEVATATGGRLVGQNAHLSGVSFDSRSLIAGQLFVPIVAARDGHDFIADAVARGAGAYLTTRQPQGRRSAVVVEDTLVALMKLGQWARERLDAKLDGRVVGITGSVGKTSTKDMVAKVLATKYLVAFAERSYNNDQGLPVTILNADDAVEALVLEMGMRGFGEIARLCSIGRPSIGVVTAVGHAHTERVGGLEGVAKAKGELVEALPSSGFAVLNADDERVAAMATRTSASVLTYGTTQDAAVRASSIVSDELGRHSFVVASPWGDADVQLHVPGRHMVSNALAALAVAGACGVSMHDAASALAHVAMSPMRMQERRTKAGAVLLDDCYNANPTSMAAALDTLALVSARRKVVVLGEMAELADAAEHHRRIAARVAELGIDLIAVGTDAYGVPAHSVEQAAELLSNCGEDEAILVKGSRVAALERLVNLLV
ncbi:MAG: UDP-N-acetylmuramoyl-tripeptide--D-alanyl-D-alanine ligase [Actinomycetota bacterium]|jgi:UDP-N-acetylmuramoyl-tripeptide--D-alanyl-D-alanine ligase